VLYGLKTTDCQQENVIAAGEHPAVVDPEAIFHRGPADAAGQRHADSVLGVRLLPQRFPFADKDEFVDLSSLDATEDQLSPGLVPCWEGSGTDEMRVVAWRAPLPGAANRPTLRGVEVNLLDYREDMIDGFRAMYDLLRERRRELLADSGPLAAFADDEVRFIARTTQSYAMLLRQSYHPNLLRNARLRERFFAPLWADVKKSRWRARLRDAERSDLLRGDIPLFTTRPASRDLWTSTGERIAKFFPHTGLELVRRRLQRLDQADLEKQLTIIRASFAG
jgi:type 2 lantibiotic biosynthesis protein LanM